MTKTSLFQVWLMFSVFFKFYSVRFKAIIINYFKSLKKITCTDVLLTMSYKITGHNLLIHEDLFTSFFYKKSLQPYPNKGNVLRLSCNFWPVCPFAEVWKVIQRGWNRMLIFRFVHVSMLLDFQVFYLVSRG